MSQLLIQQYYSNLDRVLQFGKSKNEGSISITFLNLLNEYARKQNYEVVPQSTCKGTKGKIVRPDGIVRNVSGLNNGLWESKDEQDNIDDEIDAKIKKGYPLTNSLFEDSKTAVLFQRGMEVKRVAMRDADKLHKLLTEFFSFKSEAIYKFEDALEKFKADIPTIVEMLRKRIDEAGKKNKNFITVSISFLELCKAEINPEITDADMREMMIQHILTSDIFNKIFDDPEFHRHNNIAHELEKLIETLFDYSERKNLLGSIEHYYDAMNAAASSLTDHHDKQKFLKVLYENFYKVYNPKAADRLGVVYTPNEVVQFMIESTDYLLHKHFNKTLADKNVEILDPATGTGTFISSIIDYIPNQYLTYKYQNEIHANEVAILPYYVANLNIEFTYKQKMQTYAEFKNLCFVDTLDNTDALSYGGKQHDLFGLSSENSARIKRQNSKKISVIIGNPPYNANQANENENNKNREYLTIDKRIKDTYIKHSTAQKTKLYDMYARFYRWATDRLEKNGVLAFITNRSFIDSRTFDGFRKIVASEFNEIHIVDLGGDVRANPKLSGTKNNVFGIQTGVAIMFLVGNEKNFKEPTNKKEFEEIKEDLNLVCEPVVLYGDKEWFSPQGCRIYYVRRPEMETREEKLDFLRSTKIENIEFDRIAPDKNNNWINLADNDFDSLIPCVDKKEKAGNKQHAVFSLFSNGIVTARDEWSYDFRKSILEKKADFFCKVYTSEQKRWKQSNKKIAINDFVKRTIKFGSEIENHLIKGDKLKVDKDNIVSCLFRPFTQKEFYFDKIYTHRIYQQENIYGFRNGFKNITISFLSIASSNELSALVSDKIFDAGLLKQGNGITQCLPLYHYDTHGNRIDNITDWGLEQFAKHYKNKKIKKEDIFHYTYAVLHNPAYRKKYELNLKREFPRLPFYKDFWKWAKWGKALMDLHINYEKVKPFPLKQKDYEVKAEAKRQKETFSKVEEPEVIYGKKPKVKVKLKADKEVGVIDIDELTFLTGVPKEAWEYKLGNRSALEWILDQYKEKKPSDPTIAEKFNTYRFADYKEQVIDLLKKVCTVSVETMAIIKEMGKE